MIVQGLKVMGGVIVYGVLLAIGFKIGQKTYDYLETEAKDDLSFIKTKVVQTIKEKFNDRSNDTASC